MLNGVQIDWDNLTDDQNGLLESDLDLEQGGEFEDVDVYDAVDDGDDDYEREIDES